MPANDVLVKITFQMSNARSVDSAINKLRNLGAAQNLTISRTTVFGSEGKKSLYNVSAATATTSTQWAGMAGQVEGVMSKIGRLKNTSNASMKVMQTNTGRITQGMNGLNYATGRQLSSYAKLKKASWGITMTTLSMLGIFFSVYGLINMLTRGFSTLLTPLMDVEKAAETVATAFGFSSLMGVDLTDVFGDMGSIFGKMIPAWKAMTALSGIMSTALIVLGATIFSDEKFVAALTSTVIEFAKVLTSPEVVDAIKTLILEFAKMLPSLAEMIPTIAAVVQAIAPFIPLLVTLAGVALILMPILSAISSIVMVLANVSALWEIATIAVSGALTLIAAHPVVAAILLIVTAIAAVITYFGWWDDIIKIVTDSLNFLYGILSAIPSLLGSIGNIGGLLKGPTIASAAPMAANSPTSTKIDVQQYNTNYISKDSNADEVTASLAKDFAYKVRR